MNDKMKKILRNVLLALTIIFGIATVILAGMPEETILNDGSIGYMPSAAEHVCHIAFAVSFSAWLIFGHIVKKDRNS